MDSITLLRRDYSYEIYNALLVGTCRKQPVPSGKTCFSWSTHWFPKGLTRIWRSKGRDFVENRFSPKPKNTQGGPEADHSPLISQVSGCAELDDQIRDARCNLAGWNPLAFLRGCWILNMIGRSSCHLYGHTFKNFSKELLLGVLLEIRGFKMTVFCPSSISTSRIKL